MGVGLRMNPLVKTLNKAVNLKKTSAAYRRMPVNDIAVKLLEDRASATGLAALLTILAATAVTVLGLAGVIPPHTAGAISITACVAGLILALKAINLLLIFKRGQETGLW